MQTLLTGCFHRFTEEGNFMQQLGTRSLCCRAQPERFLLFLIKASSLRYSALNMSEILSVVTRVLFPASPAIKNVTIYLDVIQLGLAVRKEMLTLVFNWTAEMPPCIYIWLFMDTVMKWWDISWIGRNWCIHLFLNCLLYLWREVIYRQLSFLFSLKIFEKNQHVFHNYLWLLIIFLRWALLSSHMESFYSTIK